MTADNDDDIFSDLTELTKQRRDKNAARLLKSIAKKEVKLLNETQIVSNPLPLDDDDKRFQALMSKLVHIETAIESQMSSAFDMEKKQLDDALEENILNITILNTLKNSEVFQALMEL